VRVAPFLGFESLRGGIAHGQIAKAHFVAGNGLTKDHTNGTDQLVPTLIQQIREIGALRGFSDGREKKSSPARARSAPRCRLI
jgi:hypothetical protein